MNIKDKIDLKKDIEFLKKKARNMVIESKHSENLTALILEKSNGIHNFLIGMIDRYNLSENIHTMRNKV